MEKGSIVGSIDVAQVVLYVFWVFFAGLIFYLRREDKREGYPLVSDRAGGGRSSASRSRRAEDLPSGARPRRCHGAAPREPSRRWTSQAGCALARRAAEPTGNPMLDGVGPARLALARRYAGPDLSTAKTKIVPMRAAPSFFVADGDPDPRGMAVIGADGEVAGTISDVWIDHRRS